MSMCYGVRFDTLRLRLKHRKDILNWLLHCKDIRDNDKDLDINLVPFPLRTALGDARVCSLINYCYNENSSFDIETLENDDVVVDFTTSFKNNFNSSIERLIMLLKPHIICGRIYYKTDHVVQEIKHTEELTCDMDMNGNIVPYLPIFSHDKLTQDEIDKLENEFY